MSSPVRKEDCSPSQRFRKAHERKLRNGEVLRVSAKCIDVKRSSPRKRPTPFFPKSPSECGQGLVYRRGYERVTKSSGKKTSVAAKCVKRRASKTPVRKSPMKISPRRYNQDKCAVAEYWRKSHERRLRSGEVKKIPGMCVKRRSPAKIAKSPRQRKASAEDCSPDEYWRKSHSRKSRSGSIIYVEGDCVRKPRRISYV